MSGAVFLTGRLCSDSDLVFRLFLSAVRRKVSAEVKVVSRRGRLSFRYKFPVVNIG